MLSKKDFVKCSVCETSFKPRLNFQKLRQGQDVLFYCSLPCRAKGHNAEKKPECSSCSRKFTLTFAYQAERRGEEILYSCSELCRQRLKKQQPITIGLHGARQKKKKARVISVLNQKGGTAKTTSSISIAAGFAERGRKVLLIDADPQGNISASLGIRSKVSFYDVLMNNHTVADSVAEVNSNLHLLTSDESLAAAEIQMAQKPKRSSILARKLEPVLSFYDEIIIDCGPSLSLLNQNVLCASSEVLVPVACDYLSLIGVKQVLKTVRNVTQRLGHQIEIGNVLPTFYDKRARICRDAKQSLEKHFKERCLPPIRQNIRLKEAPSVKKTIFEHAKNSIGAQDYLVVVEVLLQQSYKRDKEQAKTIVKRSNNAYEARKEG